MLQIVSYITSCNHKQVLHESQGTEDDPKNGQRGFGIYSYFKMLTIQTPLNLTVWQRHPLLLCLKRLVLSHVKTIRASPKVVNVQWMPQVH